MKCQKPQTDMCSSLALGKVENFSRVANRCNGQTMGWKQSMAEAYPKKHDLLIFGRWAGLNFSLLSLLEPVSSNPIPGPAQQ